MGRNRKIRAPEEEAFLFGLWIGTDGGLDTEDRDGNQIRLSIRHEPGVGYFVTDTDGLVFGPMHKPIVFRFFADLLENLGFRVRASD